MLNPIDAMNRSIATGTTSASCQSWLNNAVSLASSQHSNGSKRKKEDVYADEVVRRKQWKHVGCFQVTSRSNGVFKLNIWHERTCPQFPVPTNREKDFRRCVQCYHTAIFSIVCKIGHEYDR